MPDATFSCCVLLFRLRHRCNVVRRRTSRLGRTGRRVLREVLVHDLFVGDANGLRRHSLRTTACALAGNVTIGQRYDQVIVGVAATAGLATRESASGNVRARVQVCQHLEAGRIQSARKAEVRQRTLPARQTSAPHVRGIRGAKRETVELNVVGHSLRLRFPVYSRNQQIIITCHFSSSSFSTRSKFKNPLGPCLKLPARERGVISLPQTATPPPAVEKHSARRAGSAAADKPPPGKRRVYPSLLPHPLELRARDI